MFSTLKTLINGANASAEEKMRDTQAAMDDGNETMAKEAANAIAQMENELAVRTETGTRLEQKITRLRQSIETGNRRIIDLKQGAITAKAIKSEQAMQKRINSTLSGQSSVEEAEDMIANILGRDDPFEQADIISEIDNSLDHTTLGERMAEAGYGTSDKVTGSDVLSRFKPKS